MIIYDEDNATYHANPAISSSQAKAYDTDPLLFVDEQAGRVERKASAAMDFGTVIHQMVLEPETQACYTVRPDGLDMRTKDGKAWKASLEPGIIVLSQDDYHRAETLLDRMPVAVADLLEGAPVREATVRVDAGPMQVQARPDAWDGPDMHSLVVDLKTCADLSRFRWAVRDFGYALSAGWYCAVIARETGIDWMPDWAWVVAETNPPHRWQIVTMDQGWLAEMRDRAESLIHRIGVSIDTDTWEHQHPVSITMTEA